MRSATRLELLAAAMAVLACAGSRAAAQDADVPAVESARAYKVGMTAKVIYDSNVARTDELTAARRNIRPEDQIIRPAATFAIVQPLGRQALFLQGDAGYDYYRHNKQLNRQNVNLTTGSVVNAGKCRAILFGRYASFQSDLADLTLVGSAKNTQTATTLGSSLDCRIGPRLELATYGMRQRFDNSNALQKLADHRGTIAGARLGYGSSGLGTFSAIFTYSEQTYPNQPNGSGTGQKFTNEMIGLGYDRRLGSKLKIQGQVARATLRRSVAPAGIPKKANATSYSLAATYQVNHRLNLQVNAERGYQAANSIDKLYTLSTNWDAQATYRIGSRMSVAAGRSEAREKSSSTAAVGPSLTPTRSTTTATFGSIKYEQGRRGALELSVRQEDRKTDIPAFGYSATRATLGLAVNF
jgi:hypothetical protein